MDTFKKYLKYRQKPIAVFLLVVAIYTVSMLLYHLPGGAIVYPLILSIVLGFVFLFSDFISTKRQYEVLQKLVDRTAELIDTLPEAASLPEESYREIVESLVREIQEGQTLERAKYDNMIEYYTVWVHQIKTPIASMRLTLQEEDSAVGRKLSSDLFRIEQYVEMVLTFLRLGEDANDYVFKEQSVDSIVRQSVRKFASEFIGRKLRLEYTEIEGTFVTDEKWFGFVVEQILSNALKYTREGGIKIYKKDNCLVIEDTGIGIAPEDVPRIFEKGYTGYNGRSDRKATGLGLYLCKQICKNLGVDISAESTVGEGTKIFLSLNQYALHVE